MLVAAGVVPPPTLVVAIAVDVDVEAVVGLPEEFAEPVDVELLDPDEVVPEGFPEEGATYYVFFSHSLQGQQKWSL